MRHWLRLMRSLFYTENKSLFFPLKFVKICNSWLKKNNYFYFKILFMQCQILSNKQLLKIAIKTPKFWNLWVTIIGQCIRSNWKQFFPVLTVFEGYFSVIVFQSFEERRWLWRWGWGWHAVFEFIKNDSLHLSRNLLLMSLSKNNRQSGFSFYISFYLKKIYKFNFVL